jgi:hypothetical protein
MRPCGRRTTWACTLVGASRSACVEIAVSSGPHISATGDNTEARSSPQPAQRVDRSEILYRASVLSHPDGGEAQRVPLAGWRAKCSLLSRQDEYTETSSVHAFPRSGIHASGGD